MDKEQKAAQIDEIAERLGDANAIFAVDYRGISVPQAAELRSKLAEADTTFRVVKNRLAKRAAERAGTAELDEFFEGPIALTFVKGDAVTAAKAIATFGRQNEILEYKGGLMDGAPLEPDQFQAIARLPSLDVLHGRLVVMTASPLTGLARGLAAMISGLAVGLGQIAEKGLVSGEAEEAAPEEPASEEAAPEPDEAEEPKAEEAEEQTQVPAEDAEDPEEQEPGSPEQEIAEEAFTGEDDQPETSDETESDEAPEGPGGEAEGSEGESQEE
jgi:large subunit ribosomal protein L10